MNAIKEDELPVFKPSAKIVWLGHTPTITYFTQSKKGNTREMAAISFITKKETHKIQVPKNQGNWFIAMLKKLSIGNIKIYTLQEVIKDYEAAGREDFELFWDNKPVSTLKKYGLLSL